MGNQFHDFMGALLLCGRDLINHSLTRYFRFENRRRKTGGTFVLLLTLADIIHSTVSKKNLL